jgi:murein DD-endopeptidase MepM/ murein hydrolase activator NlpD
MIAGEDDKNYFIELEKQFTGFEYFAANPTQPLSSTKYLSASTTNGDTNIMRITLLGGLDYVTINTAQPQLITQDTTSTSPDIITTYMLGIHEVSEEIRITKDNLFYIEDKKSVDNKSDYLKESASGITGNQNFTKGILYQSFSGLGFTFIGTGEETIFNFENLKKNTKYPILVQIPQAILIIFAKRLSFVAANIPTTDNYYELFQDNFYFIKGTNFYNYLIEFSIELSKKDNVYGYQVINEIGPGTVGGGPVYIAKIKNNDGTNIDTTDKDEITRLEKFLFEPVYLSVNSREFSNGIETTIKSDDKLYAQYLKQLLPKLAQLVKEDKKTLEDKLKNYKNQMQDNDVKLSMYKSFQVIYENYLYGSSPEEFEFDIKTNFQFVDRAYNDISTIGVLDIKTLLSDSQDTNVSLLTAISRLLSDNNYWFYPFQGFLTTTESYDKLFKIDYEQTIKTKPMFVAMYVGGLSSNPITPPNSTLANDGILKDAIPDDFSRKTGSTLNAFKVKYTGTQNQMVFSDFQHSTESLKNTDEGLRIQSEIIGNASNSFAVPKGQSLLTVYQKQSYTSTVKIPFGNMGIQPTQYYYLEFIPIFEGLYIIYNVSHNINSDTQRLETTFKGYRLKKDVNPIITSELVDFIRDNFYTQTLDTIGFPSNKTNLTPQEIQIIEKTTPKTVSGYKVTSTFLRNTDGSLHGAIDIGTPVGKDIKFTYPDTIFVRTAEDKGGYGNYIILRSKKNKVDFIFAHLQEYSAELLKLKEGDAIPITMILGKTGKTGGPRTIGASFFGVHLHFEVREMPFETNKKVSYLPYLDNLVLGK